MKAIEQLYRSQETREFYQKLNESRNGLVPRAEMRRDEDGSILTDKREVIERWKQHFDEHLNGTESTCNEGRDNGRNALVSTVEDRDQLALTLREVKDVVHQLKNNKAAAKDGIG